MKNDNDRMAVSVCIPAYNEESTIESTISSVLKQTIAEEADLEILVGANGCSDRTVEMVASLEREHPGIVRLLDIDQKGKPNAWNTLRSEAAHDVLIFMDGDVQANPGAVRHLYDTLFERDDLVLVQAMNAARMKHTSRLTRWSRPPANDGEDTLVTTWQDTICGRMYGVRNDRLTSLMRRAGLEMMPNALIHEDAWLRCVLDTMASRDRGIPLERVFRGEGRYWEVCPKSLVYFVPQDWKEDGLIMARNLHAREQLAELFPEYEATRLRLRSQQQSLSVRRVRRWARKLLTTSPLELAGMFPRRLLKAVSKRRAQRAYRGHKNAGSEISAQNWIRSESSRVSAGQK
jgi:glycosyltransferase involved in cell wall biosynthesis